MSCLNYVNRDSWESAEITGVITKSEKLTLLQYCSILDCNLCTLMHRVLTNSRQYLATVASRYCIMLDDVAQYVAGEHFIDMFVSNI